MIPEYQIIPYIGACVDQRGLDSSFQSLCVLPGSEALPSISVNSHKSYDCVKKCVSDLKKPLLNLMKKNMVKISGAVKKVYIVPLTDPNTREFLKYSCWLTLDPDPANEYLWLSEGNRKGICRRVSVLSLPSRQIYQH